MKGVLARRTFIQGLNAGIFASYLGLGGCASANPDRRDVALAPVNPSWVISEAEATAWHELKDKGGPTITGSPSWLSYMAFIEQKMRELGCVDIHKSPWTFTRMTSSVWPDKSGLGLVSNGVPIPVANFGANCGTTGADGVSAELLLWDPDKEQDVQGKIVVFRPVPRPEVRHAFSGSDYEHMLPFDSWPDEGRPVPQSQEGTHSISSTVWDDMTSSSQFIEKMRDRKPAGIIFAMNLNDAATEGLYTFPVPTLYDFPSVYVSKSKGDIVIQDALAGKSANIRVEGEKAESQAFQLVGVLPGKDYGTSSDEQIWMRTHTDGPSISQEDGALALLAVAKYMSRYARESRPRSILLEFDCRHFMPGAERAWAKEDYFEKFPRAKDKFVAEIAMEHLGQIEYVFSGEQIKPSGRSLPTWVYATGNERVITAALDAAESNDVRSAIIRSPGRPGVHHESQGPWYGMGRAARYMGIPGYGMQGDLGAYWAESGKMNRFDARSFCRQIAMFCQLARFLMTSDLSELAAPKIDPASEQSFR